MSRADAGAEHPVDPLVERWIGHEQVLFPPEYPELDRSPIFLAGPVSGAPRWHLEAMEIITRISPEVLVANPNTDGLPVHVPSKERSPWEAHHMRVAAQDGAVMFWLPDRVGIVEDSAYAKTSRIELGLWIARHQLTGSRITIGIEPGFPDEKYIRQLVDRECPSLEVRSTLEDTCADALAVTKI